MIDPKVILLVLNWNGNKTTIDCLSSLKKVTYSNYSTVLIDNASTDGSLTLIKEQFSQIKILPLEKNYGYSEGMNRGLKLIKTENPDFVVFLNNDITVASDFLTQLINGAKEYGKNNIYGPKIYYTSNPKKIWYAGGKVNIGMGRIAHRGIRRYDNNSFSKDIITDYISGCCLLISWDNINKLNGFDSRFNMYGEDVDLCIRAKNIGSKCMVIASSNIWHKVSGSIGGNWSWKKNIRKFNSILKLIKKHGNYFQKFSGIISIILFSLLMIPVVIFKQIFKNNQ